MKENCFSWPTTNYLFYGFTGFNCQWVKKSKCKGYDFYNRLVDLELRGFMVLLDMNFKKEHRKIIDYFVFYRGW